MEKNEEDWDMLVQLALSTHLTCCSIGIAGAPDRHSISMCLQAMDHPQGFKCLGEGERRILRIAAEQFFVEHGRGRAGLRPKAPLELRKGMAGALPKTEA